MSCKCGKLAEIRVDTVPLCYRCFITQVMAQCVKEDRELLHTMAERDKEAEKK